MAHDDDIEYDWGDEQTPFGVAPPSSEVWGALTTQQLQPPSFITQRQQYGDAQIDKAMGALDRGEQRLLLNNKQKQAVIQTSLDAILAQRPDHTATLLAMASGFLKPTRTGRFGESLGEAGGAAIAPMVAEKARTDARKLKEMEFRLGLAGAEGEAIKVPYAAALERLKIGEKLSASAARLRQLDLNMKGRQAGAQATQENRAATLAQRDKELAQRADANAAMIAHQAAVLNKPRQVTTADGVFQLNPDGSLGEKLGAAPATLAQNFKREELVAADRKLVASIDEDLMSGEAAEANLLRGLEESKLAPEGLTSLVERPWLRIFGDPKGRLASEKAMNLALGTTSYEALKKFFGPQMSNADIAAMNKLSAMNEYTKQDEREKVMSDFLSRIRLRRSQLGKQRASVVDKSYTKGAGAFSKSLEEPAGLSEGVTEDDIAETMRIHKMTREQVLKKLGAR